MFTIHSNSDLDFGLCRRTEEDKLTGKFYDVKQVIKQAYGFWVGWLKSELSTKNRPTEIGGHNELRNASSGFWWAG